MKCSIENLAISMRDKNLPVLIIVSLHASFHHYSNHVIFLPFQHVPLAVGWKRLSRQSIICTFRFFDFDPPFLVFLDDK